MVSKKGDYRKYHKSQSIYNWKRAGLIHDNYEELYKRYITTTNCELCGKEFRDTKDRQMEHDHKTGEFRNFTCNKCNMLKADREQSNNTSGYIGISKDKNPKLLKGYTWVFKVMIDGKRTKIKTMGDFDKLVEFADKWKKDNNYNT